MVRKQNCTFWQSFGCSVSLWGFGNVYNVGRVSSFFAGKEKNKINFHQICTVLKKLNPFFCYYLSLSYLTGCLSFYTCCQRVTCMVSFGDWKHEPFKLTQILLNVTPLNLALSPPNDLYTLTN